ERGQRKKEAPHSDVSMEREEWPVDVTGSREPFAPCFRNHDSSQLRASPALAPVLLLSGRMRAFFLTLVGCLSVACGETEPSVTGTLTLDGGGHDGAIAEHPDARRDSRAARDAAVTADGEVC